MWKFFEAKAECEVKYKNKFDNLFWDSLFDQFINLIESADLCCGGGCFPNLDVVIFRTNREDPLTKWHRDMVEDFFSALKKSGKIKSYQVGPLGKE